MHTLGAHISLPSSCLVWTQTCWSPLRLSVFYILQNSAWPFFFCYFLADFHYSALCWNHEQQFEGAWRFEDVVKRTKLLDSCAWLMLLSKFHPTLFVSHIAPSRSHHSDVFSFHHVFFSPSSTTSLPCSFSSHKLPSTLPSFLFHPHCSPFHPDPSCPLLSPLFKKILLYGWFCFHLCLGWQNCYLLWPWSNVQLSVWYGCSFKETQGGNRYEQWKMDGWDRNTRDLQLKQCFSQLKLTEFSVYTFAEWVFTNKSGRIWLWSWGRKRRSFMGECKQQYFTRVCHYFLKTFSEWSWMWL